MISDIVGRLRAHLTPDLLLPAYRAQWSPENPTAGFCYVASEALYHWLGPGSGWKPVRAKDDQGITHWWLEKDGERADPTADQYLSVGRTPPYAHGKGGGFLTRAPSKRAVTLLSRIT